ncbi:hypothetical protein VTK73DRAFT_9652 [Phialemonium thermophilum]|uniref:Uncharacterized protein n=1 Tax=Phialemonium thermophilum TaxID=223376 RepID=A0ABR3W143_9PEZI
MRMRLPHRCLGASADQGRLFLGAPLKAQPRTICHAALQAAAGNADIQNEDGVPGPTEPAARRPPLSIDASEKVVKTSSGSFPLSPLMDPSYHDARRRFERPKRPESSTQEKSKFRRRLARNPYALALAEPCRWCVATRTVVPRYFLQDFKLVSHPETGRPTWVSPSLAPSTVKQETEGNVESKGATERTPQDSPPSTLSTPPGSEGKTSAHSSGKTPAGPTGYTLSRLDLLGDGQRSKKQSYPAMIRGRLLQGESSHRTRWAARKAPWREDMGVFLLELMRRRIVEDLLYLCRLSEQADRQYVVRRQGWDEMGRHPFRGCVLWLGGSPSGAQDAAGDAEETSREPGFFATLDVERARYDRKIPVHNLRMLLGEEHVDRLRRESPLMSDGNLFLVCRKRTVQLQLKLWKLQGFMAGSQTPSQ